MSTEIKDVLKAVETIKSFCSEFNDTHLDKMTSRNRKEVAKQSVKFNSVNRIEKYLIGIENELLLHQH